MNLAEEHLVKEMYRKAAGAKAASCGDFLQFSCMGFRMNAQHVPGEEDLWAVRLGDIPSEREPLCYLFTEDMEVIAEDLC